LLILRHDRREIVWLAVTRHPTAEWIARQLTEAFGWATAPWYLLRDRDQVYGNIFVERVRAMGIRDQPIAAKSTMAKWILRKGNRLDPPGLP
jgi:hypothetical protein